MSPRVTQAHLQARRREILAAGFRCLSRGGFHGTTMQEIAEEAGLSVGSLYRYFDDKDALLRALAEEGVRHRTEHFEQLNAGDGARGLADAVDDLLGLASRDEARLAMQLDVRLWADLLDDPDGGGLILTAFDSLLQPVQAYLEEQRSAGRVRPELDPRAVARIVLSLLVGLELQLAYEPAIDVGGYRAAACSLLAGLASGVTDDG